MYSTVTVEYSQFMRNEALYGGAIYGFQESRLESIESVFEENKAVIAVRESFCSWIQAVGYESDRRSLASTFVENNRAVPMRTTFMPT